MDVLFWPGVPWHWGIRMNAALAVALLGAAYAGGIGRLIRRRTLVSVIAAGAGGLAAAKLAGAAVNHFTGWRELQTPGAMELAGKINRLILAQWHNPIWEEAVFRGIPLACYLFLGRRLRRGRGLATCLYYAVPALAFAAYHAPGHGYARIADTFLLGLMFAWLALRYGFAAVLALHCIFDTVLVLSLAKFRGAPAEEVRWLAEHAGALNSIFSEAVLGSLCLWGFLFLRDRWAARHQA